MSFFFSYVRCRHSPLIISRRTEHVNAFSWFSYSVLIVRCWLSKMSIPDVTQASSNWDLMSESASYDPSPAPQGWVLNLLLWRSIDRKLVSLSATLLAARSQLMSIWFIGWGSGTSQIDFSLSTTRMKLKVHINGVVVVSRLQAIETWICKPMRKKRYALRRLICKERSLLGICIRIGDLHDGSWCFNEQKKRHEIPTTICETAIDLTVARITSF